MTVGALKLVAVDSFIICCMKPERKQLKTKLKQVITNGSDRIGPCARSVNLKNIIHRKQSDTMTQSYSKVTTSALGYDVLNGACE